MQINRVASLLGSARAEQLRVVVVHQPIAVVRSEDEHNLLRGHRHAQQRWAAAGADLVLGGHIHLPYAMQLPDIERPVWVVQAGTAVSDRIRPGVPNSVNVIRWEPGNISTDALGTCSVEQWDFDAIKQIFRCAKVTHMNTARSEQQL
jgi:predicted phosphodiesterase